MVFGTIIRVENQPEKIMSISIRWYDEDHTILYMAFEPGWTIQQWFEIVPQVRAMLDSAGGPVSAIADYRRAEDYAPPGIIGQLGVMSAAMQHHRLSGLMVFVGAVGFAAVVLDIFSQVYLRVHLAETVEEAEEIIHTRR
ncbi:MAG: hypothetical protein Kow00124_25370 [Anaerolineae bacterium]